MTPLLLTFYPSWDEIAELVLPQRAAYCARHGYAHLVHRGPYHDAGWYYAVQRLQFVRDLFARGEADLVWVLNVAAVILDSRVAFTDFARHPYADVFIGVDNINGINAGSFIIRRSHESQEWLDAVIAGAQTVNHIWHEQRVMTLLSTEPRWRDLYSFLSHPTINSYDMTQYGWPETDPGHVKPGCFVVSFPGLPMGTRLSLIRNALQWPWVQ